jgi:hypothetical protein
MRISPRIAVPVALVAATVLLFDIVAWFVVPEELTRFSHAYRKTQYLAARPGHPSLVRNDPRGYYRADDQLGFDIRPGARAVYEYGEGPQEVFANSIGCFDRNELDGLRAAPQYHYFGGDSYTWGFAEYDSKFATVWEEATGKVAAKCGVTHTGTVAQFEKFKRVAAAVGRMPATVFVGFYVNDPANDAAFPHSTVVDGYMVDTAFLSGGRIVHPPVEEVKAVVAASVRELEAPMGAVERAKAAVWVFSLTANLADRARIALRDASAPAATQSPAPKVEMPPAAAGQQVRPTSRFGANLYYWYEPGTMKTSFAGDPRTQATRDAMLRWAAHARQNKYRLVFLLVPPRDSFDDPEFYGQVRGFLAAHGIEHLDFAPLFRSGGYSRRDLYYTRDAHWNATGNRVVGKLLAERY